MKKNLVSVVIPCRNEVNNIEKCITSILNSNYSEIEIFVIDGMSKDGTRDLLFNMAKKDSRVKVIDNPHKLTPYAFNLGAKAARGEFVQIIGSRNIINNDYIALLVQALKTHKKVSCVGGRYKHIYENKLGMIISFAMENSFGVGSGNYRTLREDTFVDTVGVPMYRRNVFDQIGYFDQRLTRNQDDDFNFRLTQQGHQILYLAEAKCTYLVRSNLSKLGKQMQQYGYFKVYVNSINKKITTLRQLIPVMFVVFLIVGGFLSIFSNLLMVKYLYLSVLLMYVILGFLSCRKKKWSYLIKSKLLFTYLVMHWNYGLGYLLGLLDFFLLRKNKPRDSMEVQTT